MSDTDFAAMDRFELEQRLAAAEDVCVMYGWIGIDITPRDSDRECALNQLWQRWRLVAGPESTSVDAHPELAGSEHALAEQYRKHSAEQHAKLERFLRGES